MNRNRRSKKHHLPKLSRRSPKKSKRCKELSSLLWHIRNNLEMAKSLWKLHLIQMLQSKIAQWLRLMRSSNLLSRPAAPRTLSTSLNSKEKMVLTKKWWMKSQRPKRMIKSIQKVIKLTHKLNNRSQRKKTRM